MAKILLIEDDPSILFLYQKIFTLKGDKIILAKNGEEGLEKAKTNPNIILLDILMPKMNGLEVLETLKKDPETKNIPVIMLTNLSGDETLKTALDKGALTYLVKSQYTPTQVADIVRKNLKV